MSALFVFSREIDFSRDNYYELPFIWTHHELIIRIETNAQYRASTGKLWFHPFLDGFGYAKTQPFDIGQGVNLFSFPPISQQYKLALQPYSRVSRASLKIWKYTPESE